MGVILDTTKYSNFGRGVPVIKLGGGGIPIIIYSGEGGAWKIKFKGRGALGKLNSGGRGV